MISLTNPDIVTIAISSIKPREISPMVEPCEPSQRLGHSPIFSQPKNTEKEVKMTLLRYFSSGFLVKLIPNDFHSQIVFEVFIIWL